MKPKVATDGEGTLPKARPAPDAGERAAITAAAQRVRERAPRVAVKFSQGDNGKIELQGAEHNDHQGWLARTADAFGSSGMAFALSQLNQIMTACRDNDGKIDATRVNAMLSIVEAAKPTNELQAALAVQMAMTHFATLALMCRAMKADQISQFDSAGNMTVKFARTFAMQVEAFAKLQRGGEQIVKVVHVHPGGQAIVGNVTTGTSGASGTGGGVLDENGNQAHAKAIAAAPAAPAMQEMRGNDAEWQPLPITRGEG